MNRCEEMQGLLAGLLYGELDPDETHLVTDHLDQCADCAQEWRHMRHATGLLRQWEDEEPPVRWMIAGDGEERRSSHMDATRPWRQRLRVTRVAGWAAVAAALLLVVFRTDVSYESGRFTLSLGGRETVPVVQEDIARAGVPLEPTGSAPFMTRDEYVDSQGEMMRFFVELLRESEDRQIQRVGATMEEYIRDAELRQETGFELMGAKVSEMELSTETILQTIGAGKPLGGGESNR